MTDPSAYATPGMRRTVVAIDWGIGLRIAPVSPVVSANAAFPRMTKSTFS